uniref:GINS complex subunit 4 n=1 Tax=Anopheles christyi TaxID=43041 RepID=A0A182JXJ5_9DIPT
MEYSDFDSENQPEESSNADLHRNGSSHAEIDDEIDEDDEEEIQMSSQEVLEALQRAWINEKFAPDLLPYEDALMEMVMIQLVHMEENLATANKNDLLYIVHRMEVERIRFIVSSYLRCRLQKIETYAPHILEVESGRPRNSKRLSAGEQKFAVDFHESVENHFNELVTRHMPQNHQDDERSRRIIPILDTHVFARARQDVGEYSLAGASIDPYSIVSEKDYEKLDEFIPHISEVPIGNVLNNRILDPAIGKYFVLAQFGIQYLLFCKQFLDETVLEIRNTIQTLQDENVRLEKMNKKRNEEVTLLQRKLQRAETMEHHQHTQAIYPCTKCTKNFISPELLNAHMMRKHASNIPRTAEPTFERNPASTDTNLINTIKLELEVKQLKERLNAAEKDLHTHRTKHHRCRVCSEDSSSATDRPSAKVLHSVAIQTNLTDDKDSNDKVAQTQTDIMPQSVELVTVQNELPKERAPVGDLISKSDLQSFLDEQKCLFESWKTGERQKLNQEIETVKKNLIDVIQTMEKSESNTPTPVVDENGIWKDRYHELEKMYETSQKQVQETIKSFERNYTQKMEQMEKLLLENRALEHKENPHTSSTEHTNRSTTPHNSTHLKMVTLPTVVIERESVADDGIKQTQQKQEENITHTNQSISSESEQDESDEEPHACLETLKTRQLLVKTPLYIETMQESITEPKPQAHQISHQASLISPKKLITSQFRARLKAIGVDSKSKQLFGEHLNAACKALADRRDVQKQKHNHFFITRNQLLAKVDQLAQVKIGETPQNKESGLSKMPQDRPIMMNREKHIPSAKVPAIKPRLKTSSAMELLPSKLKLHSTDTGPAHQTDMNVFKSKTTLAAGSSTPSYRPTIKLTDDDIITVHAEVSHFSGQEEFIITPNPSKRPSISSYDQQIERMLHTPIKTIHSSAKSQDRVQGLMAEETIPSNSSETIESLSTSKPIPKKRVLFNLDKEDNTKAIGTSMARAGQPPIVEEYSRSHPKHGAHKTSKVDDESDWNISSFDEDK